MDFTTMTDDEIRAILPALQRAATTPTQAEATLDARLHDLSRRIGEAQRTGDSAAESALVADLLTTWQAMDAITEGRKRDYREAHDEGMERREPGYRARIAARAAQIRTEVDAEVGAGTEGTTMAETADQDQAQDRLTLAQAKALGYGDRLHYTGRHECSVRIGPRGGVYPTVTSVRVNGAPKTWKTRPHEVRVPVKHGLRHGAYVTHRDLADWHLASACRIESLRHW